MARDMSSRESTATHRRFWPSSLSPALSSAPTFRDRPAPCGHQPRLPGPPAGLHAARGPAHSIGLRVALAKPESGGKRRLAAFLRGCRPYSFWLAALALGAAVYAAACVVLDRPMSAGLGSYDVVATPGYPLSAVPRLAAPSRRRADRAGVRAAQRAGGPVGPCRPSPRWHERGRASPARRDDLGPGLAGPAGGDVREPLRQRGGRGPVNVLPPSCAAPRDRRLDRLRAAAPAGDRDRDRSASRRVRAAPADDCDAHLPERPGCSRPPTSLTSCPAHSPRGRASSRGG
jgi:hypothetical protein